jgi:hypothetical protein
MDATTRKTLIDEARHHIERLLEQKLAEGSLTLDEIEDLVEEVGREMDTWLEERLIQQQQPAPSNRAACPICDKPALYKRTLESHILTSHGSRLVCRRYHHCGFCNKGFSPIDGVLGLEEGRDATRRIRAWMARYGSDDTFASVPSLLRDLRGIVVSESTVERTTVEVGNAVWDGVRTSAGKISCRIGAPTPSRGPGATRLYIAMDGVFCPLREQWRRDGSLGNLVCRYGEAKIGIVYQTGHKEGLDCEVVAQRCVGTLGDIEEFTPLLVQTARSWGSDRAREVVVLGDGAAWIWNLASKYFPSAIQIVDFWHMTEHLHAVANARYGENTPAAAEWVEVSQWCLEHDLGWVVVNRIEKWEPKGPKGRALREREIGYFRENAERMRYGTFLKKGYHIGSGVVESGCKQLVTRRFKQAGMHWREETAQAVLAIRAHLRSSDATDLRAYA